MPKYRLPTRRIRHRRRSGIEIKFRILDFMVRYKKKSPPELGVGLPTKHHIRTHLFDLDTTELFDSPTEIGAGGALTRNDLFDDDIGFCVNKGWLTIISDPARNRNLYDLTKKGKTYTENTPLFS
jgi:hypothetical protein